MILGFNEREGECVCGGEEGGLMEAQRDLKSFDVIGRTLQLAVRLLITV